MNSSSRRQHPPTAQRRPPSRLAALCLLAIIFAIPARAPADSYQWEYINPSDPTQGIRQSTTLAPQGRGVNKVPSANLSRRDLTMAYLTGANLNKARFELTTLTDADLSHANLTQANFASATL